VWIDKSGSPMLDGTHISSVYSGGVPLIGVHNYVNEISTREKIYTDIYFIILKW